MATYSEKLKHPKWQKKRLQVLNRDKFTCQECGDKESTLHVHHIAYHTNPWDTPLNLLITLCANCHKQEEENLIISIEKLINTLKSNGFMSSGFAGLNKVFTDVPDRGWKSYEPIFDVIKQIIKDDDLMHSQEDLFWGWVKKDKINNG